MEQIRISKFFLVILPTLALIGCQPAQNLVRNELFRVGSDVARTVGSSVSLPKSNTRVASVPDLERDDRFICGVATRWDPSTRKTVWFTKSSFSRYKYVVEARRRGLDCTDVDSLPAAGVVSRPKTSGKSLASSSGSYRIHAHKSAYDVCYMIEENADPRGTYATEAKIRGLVCSSPASVAKSNQSKTTKTHEQSDKKLRLISSVDICLQALDRSTGWNWSSQNLSPVKEAKRRGFSIDYCRRITSSFWKEPTRYNVTQQAPVSENPKGKGFWCLMKSDHMITGGRLLVWYDSAQRSECGDRQEKVSSSQLASYLTEPTVKSNFCKLASSSRNIRTAPYIDANLKYGLGCPASESRLAGSSIDRRVATAPNDSVDWSALSEDVLCMNLGGPFAADISRELISRQLDCGLGDLTAYTNRPRPEVSVDRDELERLKVQLARLQAEKTERQAAIAEDAQRPSIQITASTSNGPRGVVSGIVKDNVGVAELVVDGRAVNLGSDGQFSAPVFIPSTGLDVEIVAYDLNGLSTTETVRLERTKRNQEVSRLTPVNPLLGPKQQASRDRAALIIGLEKYEASAPAQFASRDAQMFADYAREKLGIPAGNVKVLTDSGASEREILTALKVWLPTAVKPDITDLYVFYAGHGMPTADGTSAYLVPYDGDVRLLEDTAISRKRFFNEIGHARPRSATFFFDNCYSGATRSEQQLLAARPLTIKVKETDVPDNYLVFTAGESNQTAGVLDEVKHGRFSYFVFKGLEGEADSNQDGKISAGELHAYVRESVGRFSAGAQTPTMLGDSSRWVLR